MDGYTITLDGGLRAGESNQVLVWLGRDGQPVNDLQLHLGAYGHLVALRQGTWRTCMCTRRRPANPARWWPSGSPCPRRAPTGCSSSSDISTRYG